MLGEDLKAAGLQDVPLGQAVGVAPGARPSAAPQALLPHHCYLTALSSPLGAVSSVLPAWHKNHGSKNPLAFLDLARAFDLMASCDGKSFRRAR